MKKWSYVEQVKPRHGIAAPLKHKGTTLRGQVFCFLPLPLYSGLPVHINGHFILNSTRRNLWVATDEEGDDKSRCNQNILQAIASSYAQFLERMPEYFAQFEGFTSRKTIETTVIEYYKCFPCKKHKYKPLSEPWLNLTDQVFQIMSECNSPVLAVPTNVSSRSSDDKYPLQWQPLKCEQMPASQVYFWRDLKENNKEMKSILERIGMKITCAPLWIMNQFKDVKCELPIISRSSVYEFYISFNKPCHYPCDIQDTPFKSVEHFKSFTEFLLESQPIPNTFELGKVFPKQPFGYPLLLNACNQLCIFDQANKVLCSKYMQLFPKCSEFFLHRNLIDCGYCSSYFISVSDNKSICTQAVKVVLETILPAELKNMYVSFESETIKRLDMKALWNCFKHDAVFTLVVDEVLKVWALLLTKSHKLFRCSSSEQLLPIIPDSPTATRTPAVMSVIEQNLKAPVLDIEVVPVKVVETLCPQPSDPIRMLKNLYYLHKEFPFSEEMNVRIASVLLSYFGTIHLRNESQCCKYLKSLPLFETMDGNITVLEGKRVYIWPSNIGQDGNEKWIEGTDLVFLKPWGTWTSLRVDTELGIKKTTAVQTYIDFIFPKFFKLNKKEQYSHMRYIRDYLFEVNYANQKKDYSAMQFLSELNALPWIGDDGTLLQPVASFYTDQKKIFQTFPEHFKLIPEDVYRGDKRTWMSFFQKIGLQKTVTGKVFITLCNDVAQGKLKETTKISSKVLFEYLFSKEEAKHHRFYSNQQFLAQVSDIEFVCPLPMPELEWIHKVPQTTNRVITSNEEVPLCKLSGSCINLYKDKVWVVKHITEVS